ncbi:MAG: alkaline phosphatase family protein [Candidatus Aminicenantes bacterium]|nr:alkaline phosphatase family protein [Candidatus Aminicenantes bacterium]
MKKSRYFLLLLILTSLPLFGYVGPGAGFAFVGSFFFIFAAFILAIFNFLTFPLRALLRFFKRMRNLKKAKFKRVLVIGFDGMDHGLFNRFREQGQKFPAFEKLSREGTFAPLWSTEPPISPVAWSTFTTGVNPGKHNIFDFLTNDRNTYMPKMAGSDIIPPRRNLRIGRWLIPLSSPRIELKRKSQSFWKIVSSKGIYASVLRMPFTFPPEKFYGSMLSGLGTPDLRGTQGSFSFYAENKGADFDISDGVFEALVPLGENRFSGRIQGPGHPFLKGNPPLEIPFSLTLDRENRSVEIAVGKEKIQLRQNELSPWVKLKFRAGLVGVTGIAQWVLEEVQPLKLYLSPINIDPEKPSMPVSHPKMFSVYLAKLLGSFATLGMAEDTWSLNERVLSEENFIAQVYRTQEEREKIFFSALDKIKDGLIIQVFETTDRIQHMFWRYLPDSGSPAPQPSQDEKVRGAILESYRRMDELLARLFQKMGKDDLLMVVSDHGFNAFNRGFNLNTWLHREGYLVLKDGKKTSGKWYADVDWSRSRAFGQGLNGIFLNLKGREVSGIVNPGAEAEALKREIKEKLVKVVDEKFKKNAVKKAFVREEIYRGPYTVNAPDVVVGYAVGYRVSWESAVNYVGEELFSDNTRMWSGDHAFTRDQIPGVFFCNRRIAEKDPGLIDISPTVLAAFGIAQPAFIEGRDLKIDEKP